MAPSGNARRNPRQEAFLEVLRHTANISTAAKCAGLERHAHHRWMRDPEFAEEFRKAWEAGVQHLRTEAMRRLEAA